MNFHLRSVSLLLLVAALSQPATAGLFGPSTNILKGEALAAKLKSQPIVLSANGGMLDVRTKSAAVGSFLVGFVFSSALASGGGAAGQNAQQMQQGLQANMQISSAFNQNLQTALRQVASDQASKPNAQIAKEGPVLVVGQQLMASLLQEPGIKMSLASSAQPAVATDLQLRISQPEWKLDFSMTSSDYTLSYQTEVSLYQKESDTVFFREICKGELPQKMSRENWERDDYSEVALAASDIGMRCTKPLIAALGLRPVASALQSSPQTPAQTDAESSALPAPVVPPFVSQADQAMPPSVIPSEK